MGPIPDELLLSVDWPDARRTSADTTRVRGRTEPGARVRIQGTELIDVMAGQDGRFEATVPLKEGNNALVVEAVGVLGGSVAVEEVVVRDVQGPRLRANVGYKGP